jgi:hypothetical protein
VEATAKLSLRTSNVEEVIDVVTRVYCPHHVKISWAGRGVAGAFDVIHGGVQPSWA